MIDDLHLRYAPTMRFSSGENFFPMRVDDFLAYSALYSKGRSRPLVPAGQLDAAALLAARGKSSELFVRSVASGPLRGLEVAAQWSRETLALLSQYARTPANFVTQAAAEATYDRLTEESQGQAKRFWWNSLLPADHGGRAGGSGRQWPRFILPGEVQRSALERYQQSQHPHPAYTYYYRFLEQGGYLTLQYWFYYAYNDWANGFGGFNDHEGDWEGFHLFFRLEGGRPVEPPAYACYLGHHSRITRPWTHPDLEIVDGHPVVNVAAGSHASYPQRKLYPLMALYNLIDYATGDALTLHHDQWRNRLPLDRQPWLDAYRGSWGTRYWLPLRWLNLTTQAFGVILPAEIALPGVSAPRGPRYNDEGQDREVWSNPLAFASL